MSKLSIKDLDLRHKRVFIRVDFNVPLAEDGSVAEDTRIRETLPTIEYALRRQAKVILASHLGRPKGKPVPKLSLKRVAERLRALLDRDLGPSENVGFCPDCVGPEAEEMAARLEPGQALLLENLRFHPQEETNDAKFAKALAGLAELYVNDAFGAAHRAHASTEGITHFIKPCAAGLLMEKELEFLGKLLARPPRPFIAILGGAKVSEKIGVIRNLMTKVDALLIGGAMAYTFMKSQGRLVGKSLVEDDKLDLARHTLEQARSRNLKLLLPVDDVIANKLSAEARHGAIDGNKPIPPDMMGVDIGPMTVTLYKAQIEKARTIVWNGPMGVFEIDMFAEGTVAIARAVANNRAATSVVGGGDSVAAVHAAGVAQKISHISTGGGASLEFLEGKKLPGVEALTNKR